MHTAACFPYIFVFFALRWSVTHHKVDLLIARGGSYLPLAMRLYSVVRVPPNLVDGWFPVLIKPHCVDYWRPFVIMRLRGRKTRLTIEPDLQQGRTQGDRDSHHIPAGWPQPQFGVALYLYRLQSVPCVCLMRSQQSGSVTWTLSSGMRWTLLRWSFVTGKKQ